jgi:peptidoglycan/xylan/chitin deacetylase (PgdA/CDA1 family)
MTTIRTRRERLQAAVLSLIAFILLPMQRPAQIAAGQSKFLGSTTNAVPTAFTLNGTPCNSLRSHIMNRSKVACMTGLLLVISLGASQASPAQTAASCNIAYSVVSQWSGGFQGDVQVTNAGSALTAWTLSWTFPSGQAVTQLWNGVAAQAGAAVTVANASFNADVGTGSTVDIGFTASLSGTNTPPVAFTLNGAACAINGATTATPPPPSSGAAAPSDGIPLPSAGVVLQGVTTGPLTILNWGGFKAAASFTFDDSQPSQIQHFADIQAVGVPVTYYITTGLSSEANYNSTWTAAVNAGDELGNHTEDHCESNLTDCITNTTTGNLTTELDNATAFITQNYPQKAVWTGASPYGDTGYDTDASARFFVYRGIEGGSIKPNDATNPFNLPCHLAAQGETAATFNAATDAARSAGAWQIFLIHTITPTTAIWFNPVAVTDVTGAMTHAKTAGDTWVDTVASVGAYWRGLKTLAAAQHTTSGNTTEWSWMLPAHFPSGRFLRVTVPSGTLSQNGTPITENSHGFFSVSLDAGSLTLTQ